MRKHIINRGPDGSGNYIKGNIALGHQRLSIIDISDAGAQPMTLSADGPVIVYNGEIYNFSELREDLRNLGQTFSSSSGY